MLQNKIYQNFTKEILKTFLIVLFGLTIVAWTVRAVNFLDLIVESGYSVIIYFQYSLLNLLGILTKFIPLAFLLSLIIFIVKQLKDNEFVILWTSGVKKIKLANLFFIISIFVLIFYLVFSTLITPYGLNKSRKLLSQEGFNSILPTIRMQQFSDSFKGFTFFVEKKVNNEITNIFMHDSANIFKNFTSNQKNNKSTTIVAKEGLVQEKNMILFDGQIISENKESLKNSIVKFEQLNIDLQNLQTDTITNPKLQETSTTSLLRCIFNYGVCKISFFQEDTKKEIITILNRRIILPFYIPVIAIICSFLLIKVKTKKNYFLNQYTIFILSFFILLFSELIIRFTGISKLASIFFIILPIIIIPILYGMLAIKLNRESILK
jgi:lipopolysaccharide export system permease protein